VEPKLKQLPSAGVAIEPQSLGGQNHLEAADIIQVARAGAVSASKSVLQRQP
jgi:hypothetical protein